MASALATQHLARPNDKNRHSQHVAMERILNLCTSIVRKLGFRQLLNGVGILKRAGV